MAFASDDAVRNTMARKDCVRGTFKDYYLQGRGGDPSADYKGRVYKLSQDYPTNCRRRKPIPGCKIDFKNGGPVDPKAYLQALLDYGLEGNIDVDFYVQDNKVRKWYGMPWMDWNTEVASDWPGTDGREFVHGLTHEFDSERQYLRRSSEGVRRHLGASLCERPLRFQRSDRSIATPMIRRPGRLESGPHRLNSMPDGSYVIKLLFSTVNRDGTGDRQGRFRMGRRHLRQEEPAVRNAGPLSRYERKLDKVRLIQIDLQVRDDRSPTGWLLGTYGYDGNAQGETPWERMVPLGIAMGQQSDRDLCPDARGRTDPATTTS